MRADVAAERIIVPQTLRIALRDPAVRNARPSSSNSSLDRTFISRNRLKNSFRLFDGGVPKDLGPAIFDSRQPFSQVIDQAIQFLDECLFGQFNRSFKSLRHASGLFLVKLRVQLPQVIRRIDGREIPLDGKQLVERCRDNRIRSTVNPTADGRPF